MRRIRKLVSFLLAAVIAVTSAVCCSFGASAVKTVYDMLRELKKNGVTAKSNISEEISYNYEWKANDLIFTVSGLAENPAKEFEDALSGNTLSLLFGTDNCFNLVFEGKKMMINVMKKGVGEEFHEPPISLVYFTKADSDYKLSFKIELSKFYGVSATVKNLVADSKVAAISIGAVDSSGNKTYYNGKSYLYIPFSNKKTSKINISKSTVTIKKSAVYTGSKILQDVTVQNGTYKLQKDKDYTVTYKNNVKVGTATVIITGKGNYTGTKKVSFRIVPKRPSIKKTYLTGDKAILYWNPVKGADHYYIYAALNGSGDFKLIGTVDGNTDQYPARVKIGTSYVFRMRAGTTVDGKTYYSSYSDVTKKIYIR